MSEDTAVMQALLEQGETFGARFRNVKVTAFEHGLGLSVINPDVPFELSLPQRLQLRWADVDLAAGQLRPETEVEADYRDWINAYLAGLLSPETVAAERERREAWAAQPQDVKDAFMGLGLAKYLNEATDDETLNAFLLARHFLGTGSALVLLPFQLLTRPGMGAFQIRITADGSVLSSGKSSDEIRLATGPVDSLHALNALNLCVPSPVAFSAPMVLPTGQGQSLRIGRAFHEVQRVEDRILPKVEQGKDDLRLSFLQLGRVQAMRLPKESFRLALKRTSVSGIEEIWSRIRGYNLATLFKAYVASQGLDHPRLRADLSGALKSQIETILESV